MTTPNPCVIIPCAPGDGVNDYLAAYTLEGATPPPNPGGVTCDVIPCPPTDDLPTYLGDYSLQALIFTPDKFGITNLPPGYYIAAPNNPSYISAQGCLSTVTVQVAAGASPATIAAVVQEVYAAVSAQAKFCAQGLNPPNAGGTNPPATPPGGGGGVAPTIYTNDAQSVTCSTGDVMQQIAGLPPGFSVSGTTLSVAPGSFTSNVSKADANNSAQNALMSFFGSGVQCGWVNNDQSVTCPDGKTSDVPAGTVFSAVSQADADAKALALAMSNCPGLMKSGWTWVNTLNYATNGAQLNFGSGGATGEMDATGPQVMFVLPQANGDSIGTWSNPCPPGSPSIQITVIMTYACTAAFPGGGGGTANVVFGNSGGGTKSYNFDHTSGSTTDATISVAPGQSFFCHLNVGGTSNSNGSFTSRLSVSMFARFAC